MILAAVTFAILMMLPANFSYPAFALVLFLNGIAFGLFAAPNTAAIMNSVPAESRGVASGMRSAFFNAGMPLSTGYYFLSNDRGAKCQSTPSYVQWIDAEWCVPLCCLGTGENAADRIPFCSATRLQSTKHVARA